MGDGCIHELGMARIHNHDRKFWRGGFPAYFTTIVKRILII